MTCGRSAEIFDFRFWIVDSGIQNPKSNIHNPIVAVG